MPYSQFNTHIQGQQDDGDPIAGFPVRVAGLAPGGVARSLSVNANGELIVVSGGGSGGEVWGPNAIGAAPTHPPVFVGGYDAAGNIQPQRFVTYADINGTTGVAVTEQRVAADIHVQDTGANAAIRCRSALSGVGGVGGSSLLNTGIALYDGALFQAIRQATADAMAATGIQAAGNMLWDGTGWDRMSGITGIPGIARVSLGNAVTPVDGFTNAEVLTPDAVGTLRNLGVYPSVFNGATWDRPRNNLDVTLLASASRTTTQTSAPIITYNNQAITVILNMTNVAAGPSVTVSINAIDPASGVRFNLLTGLAIVAVSTNVYRVDPDIPGVANAIAQLRLGRQIEIVVTANNANAGTYSVGYMLHSPGG
jgi:hypothetical protein